MQVLAPGETRKPGTLTGKQGTPAVQAAGVNFNVTVNLADDYWNIITDTQVYVTAETSDENGILLVSGSRSGGKTITGSGVFTVKNKTAWFGSQQATHTVTVTAPGWEEYTSSQIKLDPGVCTKLQVLLPNEAADPGSDTGKTVVYSTSQTAGEAFNVTVNAVDAYWNIQKSSNPVVKVESDDEYYEAENQKSLFNGTADFWVILNDATNDPWTVTASTADGDNILPDTSSNISVVPAAAEKLQVLLPGETAEPGSVAGKTGTPTPQPAGTQFKVTVNCVDEQWNRLSNANPTVYLGTDNNYYDLPGNQSLVNGTTNFAVTLFTAESTVIKAYDFGGIYSTGTSSSLTVNAAEANKLQILVEGENPDPGNVPGSGKSGSPVTQHAGIPFKVTVNIVDQYWNVKTSVEPGVTVTTPDDPFDAHPSSKTLINGSTTFWIDFRKAQASSRVRAEDTDGTGNYYGIVNSPGITVLPDDPAKLLVICPGETYNPGDEADGKTADPPTAGTAGEEFGIDVYVTDLYYNTVTSTEPEVSITLEDSNSTPPSNRNLTAGATSFPVTFKTAGSWYIKADDVSATYQSYTTPDLTVNAAAAEKLLVILPGETYAHPILLLPEQYTSL